MDRDTLREMEQDHAARRLLVGTRGPTRAASLRALHARVHAQRLGSERLSLVPEPGATPHG